MKGFFPFVGFGRFDPWFPPPLFLVAFFDVLSSERAMRQPSRVLYVKVGV